MSPRPLVIVIIIARLAKTRMRASRLVTTMVRRHFRRYNYCRDDSHAKVIIRTQTLNE